MGQREIDLEYLQLGEELAPNDNLGLALGRQLLRLIGPLQGVNRLHIELVGGQQVAGG